MNPKNSVFISYSRRDKPFVQKLVKAFNDVGRDVWIDWEDIPPVADWRQEIHTGIDQADDFVFIISPDSVESQVCTEELARAIEYNKRLVPLLYREVTSYKSIHDSLSSHNWIFFNDETLFDQSFQKLIEALDTDLEYTRAHTRLLTRALEWEKKGHNASFVLRGQDLQDAELWISQAANKSPRPTELQSEYIYASRQAAERRRRYAIAGLVVGLGISIALSVLAVTQSLAAQAANNGAQIARQAAEHQEANARSLLLADRAYQSYLDGDVDLAIALALEANLIGEPPARSQLVLSELAYSPGVRKFYEGHETSVNSVAISPDNRTALTGSFDGTSVYWDMDTGEEIIRYITPDRMPIRSVAFSRLGNDVALAGLWDWSIALWDLKTGQEISRLGGIRSGEGHRGVVNSIVVSQDGKQLLSGSNDGTMILWDLETGEQIRQYGSYDPSRGNADAIFSVDLSKDGTLAVSGGLDNHVRIWDIERGTIVHDMEGHRDDVLAVAFAPDGESVVSGSKDTTLVLWNTRTGRQNLKYTANSINVGHTAAVRSVAFSPDNTTIISAAEDGYIIVWDKASGKEVRAVGGIDQSIQELSIAVTSDGRRVLAGSSNGRLTIWDITNEAVSQYYEGHLESVNDLAFSPDGQHIATVSSDFSVKIWDTETAELLSSLEAHNTLANTVDYSPDGKYIASGDDQGEIVIWDAQSGEVVEQFVLNGDAAVTTVVYTLDGTGLFVALDDGRLLLLDAKTGQQRQEYKGHNRRIMVVVVSPDGKSVAGGSADGEIIIWNIADGKEISRYNQMPTGEHLQRIVALDFNPAATKLLFGTLDGVLALWDLTDGTATVLEKAERGIWTVDFNPDGRYAVSGDADGTLTLWDTWDGGALRRFREHRATITSAEFSPDGKHVATASRDHTALLWDMPSLQTLLTWTRENRYIAPLSCEQQAQYRIVSTACQEAMLTAPIIESAEMAVAAIP